MANVIVSNLQEKIDVTQGLKELITKAVNIALSTEDVSENVEVSIALVDDDYIQELNKQYRSLDAPTDVLSFAMRETVSDEDDGFEYPEEELLGDVVVSLERARVQAVGYDHEVDEEKTVMRQKEEKILKTIDLTRGIN